MRNRAEKRHYDAVKLARKKKLIGEKCRYRSRHLYPEGVETKDVEKFRFSDRYHKTNNKSPHKRGIYGNYAPNHNPSHSDRVKEAAMDAQEHEYFARVAELETVNRNLTAMAKHIELVDKRNAGLAELADALDLGSNAPAYGFDSRIPHQSEEEIPCKITLENTSAAKCAAPTFLSRITAESQKTTSAPFASTLEAYSSLINVLTRRIADALVM